MNTDSNIFVKFLSLLLTVSLLFSTLSLTGCATADLWRKEPVYDKIFSFYVSMDQQKLVIIGEEYHYIFDAPQSLIESLTSPIHDVLTANIHEVHLQDNGVVDADYQLFIDKQQKAQLLAQARQLNFKETNEEKLVLSGSITGKRYIPAENVDLGNAKKLNKSYQIKLIRNYDAGELAGNVTLSPLTVSGDAVNLIILSPFIALFAVSVALNSPSGQDKPQNVDAEE